MKINLQLLLCSILIAFFISPFLYPTENESIGELEKIVKDTSYGNYWDRREAIPKLGKIANQESTRILMELLGDSEPPIQESAVMTLAKLSDPETIAWFAEKSLSHQNQQVRINAAWTLKLLKTESAIPHLLTALKKNPGLTRAKIIEALSYMPVPPAPIKSGTETNIFDAIAGCMLDNNPLVRVAVAEALGRIKNPNGY